MFLKEKKWTALITFDKIIGQWEDLLSLFLKIE